jgi:hypothetical protein
MKPRRRPIEALDEPLDAGSFVPNLATVRQARAEPAAEPIAHEP